MAIVATLVGLLYGLARLSGVNSVERQGTANAIAWVLWLLPDSWWNLVLLIPAILFAGLLAFFLVFGLVSLVGLLG